MLKSLTLILCLLPLSSYAQDRVSPDDPRIYILEDLITPESVVKFEEALTSNKISLVMLASGGGNVISAIKIGYYINLKGIDTYIAKGTLCMSACGYIFLSGRFKIMMGKFGVHSLTFYDTDYHKLSLEKKDEVSLLIWDTISYFGYIGVSTSFFTDSLDIPSRTMSFFTVDKLNKYITKGYLIQDKF